MRRAVGMAVALCLAGLSGAVPAQEKPRPPQAILQVIDPGCVAADGGKDGATWDSDTSATYRLNLWLNSRESIQDGPVDVDVTPGKVVAYVSMRVTEPAAGEPVSTCLRPVQLYLSVSPIERGNYDWQFRRGTREESAARETEARAKASGVPSPDIAPTPAATPVASDQE